jgi:hypothetical protein
VVINGYYINGYWWIYYIGEYLCLLMNIILMAIGGCFIGGYWWLFHCKPLVVIFVGGYWWL